MKHIEPPVEPPLDVCRWHPGMPKDCPECEAENDAWADHLVDVYREERAS